MYVYTFMYMYLCSMPLNTNIHMYVHTNIQYAFTTWRLEYFSKLNKQFEIILRQRELTLHLLKVILSL